jgi:23S rRNA (uracil1939-C5)-methyltransferase
MNIQQKLVKGPVILGKVHSSGRCLAEFSGKNNYLEYGIPGEEVMFLSNRRKQGFRSGQVSEVLQASMFRVKPFCKHYFNCNGCPWQHIEYNHQLELKGSILTRALQKYEVLTPEIPAVLPSPLLKLYRHRTEYTFDVKNSALGFHNGNAEMVTDIKECYLQPDPAQKICDYIRSFALRDNFSFYDFDKKTGLLRSLSIRISRTGDILVLIGFSEDSPDKRIKLLDGIINSFPQIKSLNWTIQSAADKSQLQGEIFSCEGMQPWIFETTGQLKFRIHASSFFQPNVLQAERIFETIAEWIDLKKTGKVYDLYTGVGTIALFLASKAGEITGIEGSSAAIEDAVENARINNIGNARFMTGDILKTFTPLFIEEHGKPDLIVLDPPRSGTLIEIKKTINGSGARYVIYLSCNPVSLAFDLKQLTEVYKVIRIQPFDMLPHTHHLETLVLLERKQ